MVSGSTNRLESVSIYTEIENRDVERRAKLNILWRDSISEATGEWACIRRWGGEKKQATSGVAVSSVKKTTKDGMFVYLYSNPSSVAHGGKVLEIASYIGHWKSRPPIWGSREARDIFQGQMVAVVILKQEHKARGRNLLCC
jgi:hypothetical protein